MRPKMLFFKEAERCRQRAVQYAGKPEAPFLLRVAAAFEELGAAQTGSRGSKPHSDGGRPVSS